MRLSPFTGGRQHLEIETHLVSIVNVMGTVLLDNANIAVKPAVNTGFTDGHSLPYDVLTNRTIVCPETVQLPIPWFELWYLKRKANFWACDPRSSSLIGIFLTQAFQNPLQCSILKIFVGHPLGTLSALLPIQGVCCSDLFAFCYR